MYERDIEEYLSVFSARYRSLTLIGLRQSGKRILAWKFFKDFADYNFYNYDTQDHKRDNGICVYGGEKLIDLGCREVV